MTEGDRDAEIGRTLREYKEQSERLGCLLSKMQRIVSQAAEVQKASEKDAEMLMRVSAAAADYVGEADAGQLFRDIAEAAKAKKQKLDALHRQGIGGLLRDKG